GGCGGLMPAAGTRAREQGPARFAESGLVEILESAVCAAHTTSFRPRADIPPLCAACTDGAAPVPVAIAVCESIVIACVCEGRRRRYPRLPILVDGALLVTVIGGSDPSD
ncbi:MAG TPA: hypothetical protein VN151_13810, partial [Terracidiphilus sp.]|nr:hypothetical protein [Terracidiphilus sp.]